MKFRDGTAKALAWIAEKDLAEERARRKAQNKHPSTFSSPTRSSSSKSDYDSDIMTGSPSSRRTQSTTLSKIPTLQEVKDAEFCFTDEEDYQGNNDDTISMINESEISAAVNNSNKRPFGFCDSARTDLMSEIGHDIDNLIRTTNELDNEDVDYDESINNMPLSRKKSIDTVVTTGFFHNKFTEKTASLASSSPVANIVNINIHNMQEFFEFVHKNFKPSNFKSLKFWQNVIYGMANLVKNSNYISTSQNNKLHLQSFIFGVVSTNITFLIKPLVYHYVSFWIQLVCKLLKHVAVWLSVVGALYIAYKAYMSSSMAGNGNGNDRESYSNQEHRNNKLTRIDADKDKLRVRTSKGMPKLISKYSLADSDSDGERIGRRQQNNNINTNKNKKKSNIQDKIEKYNKKVQPTKSKSKPECNGLTENDMMIIKALAANKLQLPNNKSNKKKPTHDVNDHVADHANGDGKSPYGGDARQFDYEHTQKKLSHPSSSQPQPQSRLQPQSQPQQLLQISSAVHNAVTRINQGTRHHGNYGPGYDYKQQSQQPQQEYGYNYPQTNNYSQPQNQSQDSPGIEESSLYHDHIHSKNNALSAKQREYSLFSEDINGVSLNPYYLRPNTAVSPTRHFQKETAPQHEQHTFGGEKLDMVTPISTKVERRILRTPSPVRKNEVISPKKQQNQQRQHQQRTSNFDIESFNADNDSALLRRAAASVTPGVTTTTANRHSRPTSSSSATSSSSGSSGFTTASSFPPMSLSRISTTATTKTSSSRYTTPGIDTDLMSINSKPFSIESRQQSPSRNYVRTANSMRVPTERAASPHRTRSIFE